MVENILIFFKKIVKLVKGVTLICQTCQRSHSYLYLFSSIMSSEMNQSFLLKNPLPQRNWVNSPFQNNSSQFRGNGKSSFSRPYSNQQWHPGSPFVNHSRGNYGPQEHHYLEDEHDYNQYYSGSQEHQLSQGEASSTVPFPSRQIHLIDPFLSFLRITLKCP